MFLVNYWAKIKHARHVAKGCFLWEKHPCYKELTPLRAQKGD